MDKYRSLAAWEAAHQLAVTVLRVTDKAYHPRCHAVFDHLRRAAVSVEANIVEGYALDTTAQFRRHLRIAMGSAAEAECLIRTAREMRYLPVEASALMEELTGRAMRTIRGLLRSQPKPIVPNRN
jgi:four helix bundle protein